MTSIKQISLRSLIFSLVLPLMGLSACSTKRAIMETNHGTGTPVRQSVNPSQAGRMTVPHDVFVEETGERDKISSPELERTADAYFLNGDLNLAFLYYEKSSRKDPDNARVLYKKGMLFLIKQLYKEAIENFRLAHWFFIV